MRWFLILALGIPVIAAILFVIVWLSVWTLSRYGKGYARTETVPHPIDGKPHEVAFRLKFFSRLAKFVTKITGHASAQTTGWRDVLTALVADGSIAGVTLAHEIGGHGWQWLKYTSLAMCAYVTRGMLFHGYWNSWQERDARRYAERWGHLWATYVLKDGTLYRWFEYPAERRAWQKEHGLDEKLYPIPTRETPDRLAA